MKKLKQQSLRCRSVKFVELSFWISFECPLSVSKLSVGRRLKRVESYY